MASACNMLLARSKPIEAPLGKILLCADSMPGCAEPMLFGRYTTPSGSMPLLTDMIALLADMLLWPDSIATSTGSCVPLGCRMAFMGRTPLCALSSGGG